LWEITRQDYVPQRDFLEKVGLLIAERLSTIKRPTFSFHLRNLGRTTLATDHPREGPFPIVILESDG
jgi:hypothetical protein